MVKQKFKRGVLLLCFMSLSRGYAENESYWSQSVEYIKNAWNPVTSYLKKKKSDLHLYMIYDLSPQIIEAVFLDQTRKNIKKTFLFATVCALIIGGYYFQNRSEKIPMRRLYPFIKRKSKFTPVRKF
jgi:hypothetical protein